MALGLFDLKKIIETKAPFEWEEIEGAYSSFMMGRAFSMNPKTLFFAEALNTFGQIEKKQSFSFYYNGLPKKSHYDKWAKVEKISDDVEMLSAYYDINNQEASSMLKVLTDDQLNALRNINKKGGKK